MAILQLTIYLSFKLIQLETTGTVKAAKKQKAVVKGVLYHEISKLTIVVIVRISFPTAKSNHC